MSSSLERKLSNTLVIFPNRLAYMVKTGCVHQIRIGIARLLSNLKNREAILIRIQAKLRNIDR
jgi:hypothetical protein